MPNQRLSIVSIAAEVSPFSKTGGLADVARSLPVALKHLGHRVVVITPLYGQADDIAGDKLELLAENVPVTLNSADTVTVNFWQGELKPGLSVYFIENKKYFSNPKNIYGSAHENARFLIFDVAALKLISWLKFEADILHCHDWHTGLIPYYLKTDFRYSKTLRRARTVFTIHNLAYQLGHNWWEIPEGERDNGRSRIPHLDDPALERLNFVKRAILTADTINTVSERYREEIQTPEHGQDLQRILKNRADRLFGIVNGIDYKHYNPVSDPGLPQTFDHRSISRKAANKEALQHRLGLPVDTDMPLICSTSRVTFQKGFELVCDILDPLLQMDIQFVVLGDGDPEYIKRFKAEERKHRRKFRWVPFADHHDLETSIYAGADLFLLPSHHEPCGINQLIAMRYGCIPVVRRVGGLNDTVTNYNPATNRGNGFSFGRFNVFPLYGALIRALETMKHRKQWRDLVVRAMKQSNDWEIPARKYVNLYRFTRRLVNGRNGVGEE